MKEKGVKMRVCEYYYTIADLCVLLRLSDSYLRRGVKQGKFGPLEAIVQIEDGQLRIPASGVNFFLASHALEAPRGLAARSVGELRRKIRGVQTSAPSPEPEVSHES